MQDAPEPSDAPLLHGAKDAMRLIVTREQENYYFRQFISDDTLCDYVVAELSKEHPWRISFPEEKEDETDKSASVCYA